MAEKQPNQTEKIWAAVAYVWILSLVALAAKKDNSFVRFHANQGLLLFVISLAFAFFPLINFLVGAIVLVVAIFGIVKALEGERWELPFGGPIAKKFGNWLVKTIKL